jgi:hypothetical protein
MSNEGAMMGLDCAAKIIAGVEASKVYKEQEVELEINKVDKYGNKYIEIKKADGIVFCNKIYVVEAIAFDSLLDKLNLRVFGDHYSRCIYGVEIANTGSQRIEDDLYKRVEIEDIQKGLQRAREIFGGLGIPADQVSVYVFNYLSY